MVEYLESGCKKQPKFDDKENEKKYLDECEYWVLDKETAKI